MNINDSGCRVIPRQTGVSFYFDLNHGKQKISATVPDLVLSGRGANPKGRRLLFGIFSGKPLQNENKKIVELGGARFPAPPNSNNV